MHQIMQPMVAHIRALVLASLLQIAQFICWMHALVALCWQQTAPLHAGAIWLPFAFCSCSMSGAVAAHHEVRSAQIVHAHAPA